MSDEVSKDKEGTQFKQIPPIDLPLNADSKANAEEKVFESFDDYDKESRKKDHQRGEKLKDILHSIVIWGVMIMGVLLIIGILVWAWHILVSDNWHWLSTVQIYDMQKIMSSALLALVVKDYSKRYLK